MKTNICQLILATSTVALLAGCTADVDDPERAWEEDEVAAEEQGFISAKAAVGSTACYDWSCEFSTKQCTFNASCSSVDQGSIWRYEWDFGDGSTQQTSSAVTTHTYTNRAWADVQLKLVLTGNEASPDSDCRITVFNVIGPPIEPTSGTCEGLSELALHPTADAFVAQDNPNTNYGNASSLRVRHTATGFGRYSFLKFQVPSISGIDSAQLELRTEGTAIPETGFYRLNNMSWSETGVTWNNWQGPGTTFTYLGSKHNLSANQWHSFDLTGSVSPGARTFGLASGTNQGGLDYRSRSTSYAPILRIRFEP